VNNGIICRVVNRARYTRAVISLCFIYLLSWSQLNKAEPLVVLTEAFYPMSYAYDGQEEVRGYATELVRAILEEADIEYTLTLVPWARAMHTIDNRGGTLVYSMARTTAREEKYHWVGEIWPLRHYLYGLRKYKDRLPTSIEDALEKSLEGSLEGSAHLRIGVHRGDVVYDYLVGKGFKNLIEVKDMEKNLFLLHRDRVDLVPFADFALGISAAQKGYKVEDLLPLIDIHDIASVLSIALSKKTDPEIVAKLKQAYRTIRKTGRYDEIMKPLRKIIDREPKAQSMTP
jgi:polar amino acid transport system substrate-binding protein